MHAQLGQLQYRVAELEAEIARISLMRQRMADELNARTKQVEELQEELDNEKAREIHTCHDNCTKDGCVNRRLRQQIEQLSAALAAKDEALKISSNAVKLAGWDEDFAYINAMKALALQPHASILNKIKADAILKAVKEVAFYTEHDFVEYANRIEKEDEK